MAVRSVVVPQPSAPGADVQPGAVKPAPPPSAPPPQPLSRSNFGASLGLSVVGGIAGFAGGIIGGYTLLGCSDEGSDCKIGFDNAELAAGTVLGVLGAALGAHLGGYRADSRGNFGATLLAVGIPGAIGVASAALSGDSDDAGPGFAWS